MKTAALAAVTLVMLDLSWLHIATFLFAFVFLRVYLQNTETTEIRINPTRSTSHWCKWCACSAYPSFIFCHSQDHIPFHRTTLLTTSSPPWGSILTALRCDRIQAEDKGLVISPLVQYSMRMLSARWRWLQIPTLYRSWLQGHQIFPNCGTEVYKFHCRNSQPMGSSPPVRPLMIGRRDMLCFHEVSIKSRSRASPHRSWPRREPLFVNGRISKLGTRWNMWTIGSLPWPQMRWFPAVWAWTCAM